MKKLTLCIIMMIISSYSFTQDVNLVIEAEEEIIYSCIMVNTSTQEVFEIGVELNQIELVLTPYVEYNIIINRNSYFSISAENIDISDDRELTIEHIDNYYFKKGILYIGNINGPKEELYAKISSWMVE